MPVFALVWPLQPGVVCTEATLRVRRRPRCKLWLEAAAVPAPASGLAARCCTVSLRCRARLSTAVAAVAPRSALSRGHAATSGHGAALQTAPRARNARPRPAWQGEATHAVGRRQAAEGSELFAGEPAQPTPVAPKRRAPNTGKYGETTADGRPLPDERTVADLVRRGWFNSEQAAVALLTRASSRTERFPFETAEHAADWLEATLGPEPVKDGLCPAARAVRSFPNLLYKDAATLQRKWDALTWSAEQGGVGIAFSAEQAREAVRKQPQLLSFSVDAYKTGWSC